MSTELSIVNTELTNSLGSISTWADSLEVATATDFKEAAERIKEIKTIRAKVDAFFDPSVDAAYKAHKAAVAAKKQFTTPLDSAEKTAKSKMQAWQDEENRKAAAEQARLQAEADERARKEQAKLEARAEKAEASGKLEKAEALRSEAASVTAFVPTVQTSVPTVSGVSGRKRWVVKRVDLIALVKAAATRPDLTGYLTVDTAALARAKAANPLTQIPGVEFAEESSISIRK